MDCWAYTAIPKLKMLWLDAFGTPKIPGGVKTPKVDPAIASRASYGCPMVYYEMREINLYLWIVGPIEQFRSSKCFG